MKPARFRYERMTGVEHATARLAQEGGEARILAGGQSLMPLLNMRLASPAVLLDINRLADLSGIARAGDAVRIGALTRHCEVERAELVAAHLPLLAAAMPHVAHVAIRNRGTIGGSLALADPAAEIPACALALRATIEATSRRGVRRIAADDFFQGLYTTALAADELLTAIEFPVAPPGARSAFLELARRQGDYALVGVAVHCVWRDGAPHDLRLVFFGCGDRPVAARSARDVLEGRKITPDSIRAATAELARDLEPGSDPQTSAATRLHLARVLLGRALAQIAGSAP
jgi:aerobic carbon-monoxide dehydrogenase medium subunit